MVCILVHVPSYSSVLKQLADSLFQLDMYNEGNQKVNKNLNKDNCRIVMSLNFLKKN